METIAFCEFDKHAQRVLKKHWPDIPMHEDVRLLDGKKYRGTADVVCGGFPCQDLSTAGKQKGFDGDRSSLYIEMFRIIGECRPRYAIFENVAGLLSGEQGRWFAKFLYDLAEVGYDAEWHSIPASYVGRPQNRDRVWIIAYPKNDNVEQVVFEGGLSRKLRGVGRERISRISRAMDQPGMGRVADGLSPGVDRFKRLGNAVVPQIPELIGRAIMEVENEKLIK